MMKPQFFHLFLLLFPVLLAAQGGVAPNNNALAVSQDDLRVEQRTDGGFHLYIRKKPGIGSVLITESTRDPELKAANYAYRTVEWNPVNGDEVRYLDGKPIPKSAKVWSLISSTPKHHPELGEAFHIFIPYILQYGYSTGRHGEVYVTEGTYFNIRAFSLPYGDYQGNFRDNPFILQVAAQRPQPGPSVTNYMKETEEAFAEISAWSRGTPVRSVGPADIVERITDVLDREKGSTMDIVVCLDTTGSMKNDIEAIRKNLVPTLQKTLSGSAYRVGMVLFKDYYDDYITKPVSFTSDLEQVQNTLNTIETKGGGDIPEAVYEALYEGAVKFSWEAEKRLIILIGDAPPHLRQRGKISKDMVQSAVNERGVRIHTIILPQ